MDTREFTKKHGGLIKEVTRHEGKMPLSEGLLVDLAREELGYPKDLSDLDILLKIRKMGLALLR